MYLIITLTFYIKLCSIWFSTTQKHNDLRTKPNKLCAVEKCQYRQTVYRGTWQAYAYTTAIFNTAVFFDTGIPHTPSTVCLIRCLRAADDRTNQRITLLKDFKAHNCNRPITRRRFLLTNDLPSSRALRMTCFSYLLHNEQWARFSKNLRTNLGKT